MITRVPVNGKEIWLDSTTGVAPFRMLAAQPARQAGAGNSPRTAKPSWYGLRPSLPFEAFDRTSVNGAINETGKLTAHVSFPGAWRYGDDPAFCHAPACLAIVGRTFFDYMLQRTRMRGAEITNLKASDPSATDNPCRVDFDVTADNYFDWSAPESKIGLPCPRIALAWRGETTTTMT